MKIPTLLLTTLISAFSAISVFSTFGQGGVTGPTNIHRSLSALEAELLAIVDRKEQILSGIDVRNTEISKLVVERNRLPATERTQISQRIEGNTQEVRVAGVELSRLELTAERIRIEIDRLMRYDAMNQSGGKGPVKAPAIRSINVVKRDRKGPVQVPGQGRGFQEVTLYDVIFADGSRQRVESTSFVPQR